MSDQLRLLPSSSNRRLSNAARERGRRGVAAARAVLEESRARARTAELADESPAHEPHDGLASAA